MGERTATLVAAKSMSGVSTGRTSTGEQTTEGRWPANVCLDEESARLLDAQSGTLKSGAWNGKRNEPKTKNTFGEFALADESPKAGDSGGASRFFYVAKPGRKERDAGCEALPAKTGGEATDREDGSRGTENPRAGAGRTGGAKNFHPTVKPIALMRWLVRLVTPPGGTVLDPFTGSGTTGIAALEEGFKFFGIERDADYCEIAKARIGAVGI
jgi:site-specific DNA-methyltransferase (adenine-specific)